MEYLEEIITWAGAGLAAAVGALASIIALVVRIKKAVNTLKDSTVDYGTKAEELSQLSKESVNLAETLKDTVKEITQSYGSQRDALQAMIEQNAELRVDLTLEYEKLRLEFDVLKEAIILIAAADPALVGSGTAAKIKALLQSTANDLVKVVVDE